MAVIEVTPGVVADLAAATITRDGATTPMTEAERDLFIDEPARARVASDAIVAEAGAVGKCRFALIDAVQLAAMSPYPTPEEQAIIDAQVSGSLALFRALPDPPADVIALAAAVLTLEV